MLFLQSLYVPFLIQRIFHSLVLCRLEAVVFVCLNTALGCVGELVNIGGGSLAVLVRLILGH